MKKEVKMNQITEVEITPIKPRNGLLAFANIVLDNKIYLSSIGIYKKLGSDEYRLTYPNKIIGNRPMDIYHPINFQLSKDIERKVIDKYKEVMEKCNDRHNSFNNSF